MKIRNVYYDVLSHVGDATVRTSIDLDDRLLSAPVRGELRLAKRFPPDEAGILA